MSSSCYICIGDGWSIYHSLHAHKRERKWLIIINVWTQSKKLQIYCRNYIKIEGGGSSRVAAIVGWLAGFQGMAYIFCCIWLKLPQCEPTQGQVNNLEAF